MFINYYIIYSFNKINFIQVHYYSIFLIIPMFKFPINLGVIFLFVYRINLEDDLFKSKSQLLEFISNRD